jgi:hypothetical protein
MPELSNTVAVVTGRRIGLGRAKTLVQTRRLLGARASPTCSCTWCWTTTPPTSTRPSGTGWRR